MPYNKTTWNSGDKITASKLNNIESGIESLESEKLSKNLGTENANKLLSVSSAGTVETSKTLPSKLSDLTSDSSHRTVTDSEKTKWDAKSNFSGSYNDLTNKPDIPTVPNSLPNPYSLVFSGAVSKNYDGTESVTVNIPKEVSTDTTLTESGIPADAKAVGDKMSTFVVVSDSAEFHNSIGRGKNLGSYVSEEQKKAISSGSFSDLFQRDYWTINGFNWRIGGFNYLLGCGDKALTKNHLVIVPDSNLYDYVMNDTNTTEGGYVGSKMYMEGLEQAKTIIKAAFPGLVLSHRIYLVNAVSGGVPSAGAWVDSEVDLMNAFMVYGTSPYGPVSNGSTVPINYNMEKSQLPLFQIAQNLICNRKTWWIRDAVSSSHFCGCGGDGGSYFYSASKVCGVRPYFLIGGGD